MPFRITSTTSSLVGSRPSSSSRFFRLARMVPRTSVRSFCCALRAALSAARKASERSDTRDPRTATRLPNGGVHLPLLFLARLLIVPMLSEIGQNAGLLALLLESLECVLEAFVVVNDHFGHAGEFTPLAPRSADVAVSSSI